MLFKRFNLQMFAEGGGEGAGASASTGADASSGNDLGASDVRRSYGKTTKKGTSNSLSDVVYGLQPDQDTPDESLTAGDAEKPKTPEKSKSQMFDELVRGEYKEEYDAKFQKAFNQRFKEQKQMQERLDSLNPLVNMLSEKYGVDANDPKALLTALENDDSLFEQEALEKGLTVEQLKENKRLQRENNAFREAQERRERMEQSQKIYSEWLQQGEDLVAKYGLENFSLEAECENEKFTKMLSLGLSVEDAYKSIHLDDLMGGAMAKTANVVKEQLAASVASRQSRPSENGISSNNSQVFKTDVDSWTAKDRAEVRRRVMRGEDIRL